MPRLALATLCFLALAASSALGAFDVSWGTSWDGTSLQDILDAEFGPGVIDAAKDYEGFLPGDADPAYWEDESIKSLVVREIAGNSNRNTMGWYAEDLLAAPAIDGVGDGVVLDGGLGAGDDTVVDLPNGLTRFGFYMNPNGPLDAGVNAPEPEKFYTNRFHNDLGPDGSAAQHAPLDGDPQCLIYNVTHLFDGVPTFVLAWEDLDYGGVLGQQTDNDYNDMVVIVQALSPVPNENMTMSSVKALFR